MITTLEDLGALLQRLGWPFCHFPPGPWAMYRPLHGDERRGTTAANE